MDAAPSNTVYNIVFPKKKRTVWTAKFSEASKMLVAQLLAAQCRYQK